MKEYEFLLNINNKDILLEILNHAVDVLVGICKEEQTLELCQKFNIPNTDDFTVTVRALTQYYHHLCENSTVAIAQHLTDIFNFNKDLKQLAETVLSKRQKEINSFLIHEHNAKIYPLVEYFDWDVRLILGDSNYPQNRQTLTTLTFQLYDSLKGSRRQLHMQLNNEMLEAFINSIEMALKKEPNETTESKPEEAKLIN